MRNISFPCPNCKYQLTSGRDFPLPLDSKISSVVLCTYCAARVTIPSVSQVSASTAITNSSKNTSRYKDAYGVANNIIAFGSIVKVLAIIVGSLIVIAGLAVSLPLQSGGSAFLGIVIGVCVGLLLYSLGLLISAVGQLLLANLDTASNTSRILDEVQKRPVLEAGDATNETK